MRLRKPGVVAAAALIGVTILTGPTQGTAAGLTYDHFAPIQKRLLSGSVDLELNPARAAAGLAPMIGLNYFPRSDDGCPATLSRNLKINQNCLNVSDSDLQGRAQAQNETSIAQDPLHPDHFVASYNDYRRGDGNCYGSFSLDRGQTWADTTVPMSFTRGTAFGAQRQYWQSGGDTSVAWDTRGNAYFSCQMFMRGQPTAPSPDLSSAFYVFRSTANGGGSWNFPGRPVIESPNLAGTALPPFEDKQLMTVDNHVGSPFQDRVYVSWTAFAGDGSAYIYESFSNDYAEHFSPPVVVSTTSPLCVQTFGLGTPSGTCNENQFSQPFTAADGTLYIVFANFNNGIGHPAGDTGGEDGVANGPGAAPSVTPVDNHNQMLLAKSTDGGQTFSAPVKVADYFDLPDCATYQAGQDFGRACVPEKSAGTRSVFRAVNYPVGVVDTKDSNNILVTFGSYINRNSNESNGCIPTGFVPSGNNTYAGVKTPGACNNDILLSISNDGGKTFTGTTQGPRTLPSITNDPRQRTTDQWWQWAAMTTDGKLAVSYYDRQYGDDETTGNSDVSLSGAANRGIASANFDTVRVTSSSMPVPTQFPDAQGNSLFWGDYSGLSAVRDAFPLWSDTRAQDEFVCPGSAVPGTPPALCSATTASGLTANDQDIYTQSTSVPGR